MAFLQRSLILASIAAILSAQTFTGGIRGRATDSAGGAVANAGVRLINTASNATIETATNEQGEYAFPSINPAQYRLTVERSGFKKYERAGIAVATQGFYTIDVVLEVGDLSQSVQVTSDAPLMETVIPSAGGGLVASQLESLPNVGRNPFMVLARIAPNIVPVGDSRYQRFQDQSGTSQITIAGGASYSNNFLLDGVPVTETNNRTSIIPSIEAVQEVKLQANTYDAEMGRTGGGVFNTYLKSGSNQIHGAIFGYHRDPEWAGNDFFRNRAGIARPNQSWKNFGAAFGGPIYLPKLYDGRNRTFFWITQEAYRQKEAFAGDFALPTLLERRGDFSQSRTRDGALQTIYDPLTSRTEGTAVVRTPFGGNTLPSNRISRIGSAVANYYPAPARQAAFYSQPNYTASPLVDNRGDQYTMKADHEVTRWWRANVSYIHYKSEEPGNTWFPTIATPVGTRLNRKADATQANSTFIANPSTVIDVRYGFNRFPNLYRTVSAGFNPAELGFTGNWLNDIQYKKFPRFDMTQFQSLGAENDAQWAVYHSRNFLANVSKLAGKHNLKSGFAYRQIEIVNQPFGFSAGQFSFSDTFTRADFRAFDGRTGSSAADLLLGYPTGGTAQTSQKFFQYVRYYAGFLQDNYRVTPKLTLNLGLRYEWEPGMADRNNALIVGFDRNAAHPIGQGAKGTLLYAGIDGNKTAVLDPSRAKFAPRFGAAWAFNEKMTFRGGYGLFWAPPSYAGFNTIGYTQISQFLGTIDGGRTPNGDLANPFPSGLLKPSGNSAGKSVGVGQSISFPDQFAQSPRMHQFSFDVQRILPKQIVLTAGYVGSRSRKFLLGTGTLNINQLTADQARLGQTLFDLVPNPFFNNGGTGVVAAAQLQRAQLLRPHPQFGTVGLTFGDFNHARYDSFVIKAEKRLSSGLSFISSWTWARNRDIAIGPPNNQNGGAGQPQNIHDLASEYSLSLLDIQHRITGALNWTLPFGKGQRWLSSNRAADLAVGGWEINMVTYLQTGFPLGILQPNQNGILGAGVQRPNLTGQPFQSVQADKLNQWINPAAFAAVPSYSFGNAPRTIGYRMPGQDNVDLSLFKTFTIHERLKAQFRAEALNALNTPMFGRPDTNFNTPNFGRVTTQRNFPRMIQLGVRVFF